MDILKKYRIWFIAVIFSCSSSVIGQTHTWMNISADDAAKVYWNLNNLYSKTTSYSITVTYTSYENYTTQTSYETSSGFFNKYTTGYHSFLLGISTIQNSKYKIVVDTARKVIAVANPDKTFENSLTMADYKTLMENCTSIKVANEGNEKYYRIEFKSVYPINAYEYALSSTGWIKEMTLFYNKNYVNENGENVNIKPRLQIKYGNVKVGILENKSELDESKYFSKLGIKLIIASKYNGYVLSDQRVVPD
jgi:hypothetical protein